MDWTNDEYSDKTDEELKTLISECSDRRCENCEFWLKSNLCPKEINTKGPNQGSSMKCANFELSSISQFIIDHIRLELVSRQNLQFGCTNYPTNKDGRGFC